MDDVKLKNKLQKQSIILKVNISDKTASTTRPKPFKDKMRNIIMISKVGKIFKIYNSKSDSIFIGSTFNDVRKRVWQYKEEYKKYKRNKASSPYKIYNEDFESAKWEIIDKVRVFGESSFECREMLHNAKRYYIHKHKKMCINAVK